MLHDSKLATTQHYRTRENPLTTVNDVKDVIGYEIAHRCHGRVTKRLALRLAQAVMSEERDGMFLAEKLLVQLAPRVKQEAAMREIYLERQA